MCAVQYTQINPNNELDKKLYATLTTPVRHGFAEFGNEKTVLPIHYKNIANNCEHFEVRNTDIFVTSYPKTGTTWCQEMVWMILNNLDFENSKIPLMRRYGFLEVSGMFNFADKKKTDPDLQLNDALINSPEYISKLDSPRFIKTHLPWNLLPNQIRTKQKTPKIIYTTRNAKDTCVSFYYHAILIDGYTGDFETFCKLFLAGRLYYGHYWKHLVGYWQQRNSPNILLIRYEDMKEDLPAEIRKVAAFLEKPLSDDQVYVLAKHLTFDNMKTNPAVNYSNIADRKYYNNNAAGIEFMRSGTVGSYKKDMTPEIEKEFDQWIQEHLEKTGIQLYISCLHKF